MIKTQYEKYCRERLQRCKSHYEKGKNGMIKTQCEKYGKDGNDKILKENKKKRYYV